MSETHVVAGLEPHLLRRRRRALRHLMAWPLACLAPVTGTLRAAGLPDVPAGPGSSSARAHLRETALAHGLAAWRQHRDLNAGFSNAWSAASGWSVAAPGATGAAADAVQLRWLPASDLLAIRYGHGDDQRWVLRRRTGLGQTPTPGQALVAVQAAPPEDPQAALSADALCLMLLGPLAVQDRATAVNWGPPETLDGRRCDQLVLTVAPGLGLASESRLALFIDREQGWLRRLQWAGDNPGAGWRGLAEVDFFDHIVLQGMVWPRRFQSPSRSWLPGARPQTAWLTGLDLDRGYGTESLQDGPWTGAAAAPARPLPPV